MEKTVQKALGAVLGALGLTMMMASQSALALEPGQAATPEQLAQWGELPGYDIGSTRFGVLPERPADGQGTLLLNEQGMVGISYNEITVANAQEVQVRAAASRAAHAPLTLRHYTPTGITVLRYAEFGQAVEGLNVLKAGLPEATVRLPVQFGKPRPF